MGRVSLTLEDSFSVVSCGAATPANCGPNKSSQATGMAEPPANSSKTLRRCGSLTMRVICPSWSGPVGAQSASVIQSAADVRE